MATADPGGLKTPSVPDARSTGTIPDKIDRYLDVISYSQDGEHILLGASSLTSTLWRGSAWIYKASCFLSDSAVKPSPANCLIGTSVETGVSSGIFLNSTKLLLGCDSGALRFHEIIERSDAGDAFKAQLQLVGYCNEHSSAISDLDILNNENSVVSCSQDSCIKVWDTSSLLSHQTYSSAHSGMVTSIKTQPGSSHTFASTSIDGTALLWDIRESKPATGLHTSLGIGLTAVTWSDSDNVILGAVSGDLTKVDLRKLGESCESFKVVPRPVHRLASCPHDLSLIGVCQDSSQFTVIKCKNSNKGLTVYQDNRHEDFVRCATWHPTKKSVVTCSWDSTVLSHSLPTVEVMNGF